ncbi:FAD-binding protein [Bifidobacterium tibiigranuli]|jgi:UDP-N-acetylmuramate dehydrogenase|uniref:FAD-binding protein n=1 Tax=Bifidobacterium tibiigranuli TaxID=2172043 RepID=UPI0026ED1E46|nr:FAD-binding protein [Bifidobacterium tibiigranuli]MCI2186059.1 FAD-binding protein [Bifidobacterium tibiigranuli]MCI2204104.1 FAD-binding protein [Bifidobacterium tibiigranuli]
MNIFPSSAAPTFADLTTIGVGGPISRFVEPVSRVGIIEAVEDADRAGLPLCVIGGGSNMLAADDAFEGIVVRDGCRAITVPDEAAPVENGEHVVHVNAEAGCNWDDFVAFAVGLGLTGVEGLSGIPGTVGASVVQNIGAYGQEVAASVESAEVWDRETKRVQCLSAADLRFAYRSSALKTSMYAAPGIPGPRFFPTPRYVVLSVTFRLIHRSYGEVSNGQLAKALGVGVGDKLDTAAIREAVLVVRAAKGMLEDAGRYANPAMQGTKREENIRAALASQQATTGVEEPDWDRHSCGSFFMNPILLPSAAAALPADAPRFPANAADGSSAVKTSAAWLIDHAGFHKGYAVATGAPAALSSRHTLALTNRGGAKASDIAALSTAVRDGVQSAYGVWLIPEPVVIGMNLVAD